MANMHALAELGFTHTYIVGINMKKWQLNTSIAYINYIGDFLGYLAGYHIFNRSSYSYINEYMEIVGLRNFLL